MDDEYEEIRKHYVTAIADLLKKCTDLELLALILKLLEKTKLLL